MSLFLGPIHYWLYNKIRNQESFTSVIAAKAKEKKWITDADSYTKELPDLETAIDESNIHGWLQEQIIDAESRFASLVIEIKKQGINSLLAIRLVRKLDFLTSSSMRDTKEVSPKTKEILSTTTFLKL